MLRYTTFATVLVLTSACSSLAKKDDALASSIASTASTGTTSLTNADTIPGRCWLRSTVGQQTTTVALDQNKVNWPTDRMVYQRNADNYAAIKIIGSVHFSVAGQICIEARTTKLNADSNGTPTDWSMLQNLTFTYKGGDVYEYTGWLPQYAGGWYKLDVVPFQNGKMNGSSIASVTHVGAGEVFVIAGQSNGTSWGNAGIKAAEVSDKVSVSQWGLAWSLARSPLPGPFDGGVYGSPWVSFSQVLMNYVKVPIAIVPVGWGGSSIDRWQPDDGVTQLINNCWTAGMPTCKTGYPPGGYGKNLYERYVFTLRNLAAGSQAGSPVYRATFWHQGEADAAMPGAQYQHELQTLIDRSRADSGLPAKPWFVGLVSWDTNVTHPQIRAAQAAVVNPANQIWQGPDTDTLTTCEWRDFPCGGTGNKAHFNVKGLGEHGNMWIRAIYPVIPWGANPP